MSPDGSRRPTLRDWLFGAYILCCLGAITWPGYAWTGNRIEPYVFGLPFSLAWIVLWVLLSLGALVAYHATDPRDRE